PYMSPEQADSHVPDASAPGDLYTLGAVLYALLTGQPPFNGNSPKEVLAQMREGQVVKPRKLQPGIPVHFDNVVLKMLAGSPSDRFQTAADMLAAVEPIASLHEIRI